MSDELKRILKNIQEGAVDNTDDDSLTESSDSVSDDDIEDDDDMDDISDEMMAEVTLAILETDIGIEKMDAFMTENAEMFVRDKLLTEDVVGKSFMVLSPQARRQKAINILKLRMARDAGDPRYRKLVVTRKLAKSLLEKIRADGRYHKAEQIIRKQRFKIIQNPQAAAAVKRAATMKLQ